MKRIVTLMLAIMMVLSMATFAQADEPIRIVCYTNTNANDYTKTDTNTYCWRRLPH